MTVTPDQGVTADVLSSTPPSFGEADAATLAADLFGISGTATPLDSERDQNFLIDDGAGGRGCSRSPTPPSSRRWRDGDRRRPPCQARRRRTADRAAQAGARTRRRGAGRLHSAWRRDDGGCGAIWSASTTSCPATPTSTRARSTTTQLWDFGRVLARLGRALRGFFHPAAGRPLLWDIQHVPELRPLAARVADRDRRELLNRSIDRFEQRVLPRWPLLRSQVIHGDLSINNVTLDGNHGSRESSTSAT